MDNLYETGSLSNQLKRRATPIDAGIILFLMLIFMNNIFPENVLAGNHLITESTTLSTSFNNADSVQEFATPTKNVSTKDSINNSEIEDVLARKALSGNSQSDAEDDRFYTVVFWALAIGIIGLIIALFYFYINLKYKGKQLKIFKRRVEKIRLRKPKLND